MPLEEIGFVATIRNLLGYITGVNQMTAANARLAASELNVQRVNTLTAQNIINAKDRVNKATERVNEAIIAGSGRIADAERKLSRIVEDAARGRARLEGEVARRQREFAAIATDATARQVTASRNLENARLRLAEHTLRTDRQIDDSTRRVAATKEAVANRLAALETQRIAQIGAVATAEKLAAIQIQQAQLKSLSLIGRLAASHVVIRTAVAAWNTAQGILNATVQKFGTILIAMTGFANRFAVSLRFGLAAVTAFTAAFLFTQASGFENALLKINNLTEATTLETKQYSDQLVELSKVIPKTPEELGAGLYFILSSGIKDSALAFDILEISAKAAVSGLGEVDAVTRVITQTINAYGQENLNAAQAAEILFATAREGSAEVEDLTSSLGRVTTPAAQLGVEFNELGASIAALTNAGLPASQAITAILGILNQLLDPSAEAKDLLLEYGTSIEELQKAVAERGLIPAMKDLLETFDGNREVLTTLFPEIRGLVGIFALLSNESVLFEQALNGVNNSVGIVDEAFQNASETFSFQANLIKNTLSRALISLGAEVLPKVTEAFKDIGRFIKENNDTIQEFLAVLEQLGNGFLKGIEAITGLINSLLGAKGVLIAVSIVLGGIALLVLGPWVAGILAVIAAIGILVENFDKFKNKAIDVWGNLPDIITVPLQLIAANVVTIVDKIVGIFNNIVDAWKEAVSLVKNIANGDWSEAWENIKNIAEIAIENMILAVEAQLGILPSIFANIGARAANAFIGQIENGINKLGEKEFDLSDLLPAPLNLFAPDTGIGVKVNAPDINLPRIDVPPIEIPNLPEFKKSVEEIDAAVKQTAVETDKFGKQNLPDVEQSFQNAGNAASEFKDNLDSALSDGIISFEEAMELGIDAITAGALEAGVAIDETQVKAFEFEKTLSRIANAFQKSEEAARKLVLALAKEALSKARAAADAVLGQPSREEAAARLDIARLNLELARIESGAPAGGVPLGGVARFDIDTAEEIEREVAARENLIDSIRLQKDVLEAQAVAADDTLLSFAEQKAAVAEAIKNIREQSTVVRDLSELTGTHLIPEIDAMREAVNLANGAFAVLTNEHLRQGFIRNVDAASLAAERLAKALNDVAQKEEGTLRPIGTLTPIKTLTGVLPGPANDVQSILERMEVLAQSQFVEISEPFVTQLRSSTDSIVGLVTGSAETLADSFLNLFSPTDNLGQVMLDMFDPTTNLVTNIKNLLEPTTGLKDVMAEILEIIKSKTEDTVEGFVGQQHGGLITKPTTTLRGEHHLPELVLPLSEPGRSRELIMSLPPSLMSQIMPRQGPQIGSLIGGVSVQGIITPEIEHMVFSEVRRQLNRSRAGIRSIGL